MAQVAIKGARQGQVVQVRRRTERSVRANARSQTRDRGCSAADERVGCTNVDHDEDHSSGMGQMGRAMSGGDKEK